MSASTRLYHPTMAELRALIETPQDSPWQDMVNGRIIDKCDAFSDRYSDLFFKQNINHVELYKWAHTCLAVHTCDKGIVIFDPTIRQFYPDYCSPYFLGSPAQLVDLIHAHGGFGVSIDPDPQVADFITAHDAYWEPKITHCMLGALGYDPQARTDYKTEWFEALHPLYTRDRTPNWAQRVCQSTRSSNEVSP